jgi:hypothetical protein
VNIAAVVIKKREEVSNDVYTRYQITISAAQLALLNMDSL